MSASCLYDGHIIRFLFPKIKHFSILGNSLVRGFRCLRQVRLIHAAHLVPFELQPMLQVFLHVEGVTLIEVRRELIVGVLGARGLSLRPENRRSIFRRCLNVFSVHSRFQRIIAGNRRHRRFSAEGHSSAVPTGQRPCPSDPQTRIPAGCGDHRRGTI